MRRVLLTLLLLGTLPGLLHAQVRYRKVPIETISARLSASPQKDSERHAKLKELFIEAGCQNLSESPVKGQALGNLICVLPGSTPKKIIVGAHFDHVDAGNGVVDNWSGAALLPSLFYSISAEPRSHTIVFIGFTAEEKGLVGSKAYVKALKPEELASISAMVNIDTLGLSPTKVWATHANPGLALALGQIARLTNLPLGVVNVDRVGSSDSESFREKKIPAITIHSVTQETWRYLHTPDDKLAAIKMNDYYDSYNLLSAYLVMLDQGLDRELTPAPASPEPTKTQ